MTFTIVDAVKPDYQYTYENLVSSIKVSEPSWSESQVRIEASKMMSHESEHAYAA